MHERLSRSTTRLLPASALLDVRGPAAPDGQRVDTYPSIAPDRVSRAVGSPQPPRRGNGDRAPARARGPGEGQQTVN
jgi:hypothetical protein